MLKNTELYFVHGWGFSQNLWNDWLAMISPHVPFYLYDRGYFASKKQEFSLNISHRAKIVIAHSLGLHFIGPNQFNQIHALILISSFKDFHKHAENYALSKKTIALMKNKLTIAPHSVLAQFYAKCGAVPSKIESPILNRELLYEDLVLLDKHQIDLDNLRSIPQLIFLHGKQDTIVSAKHSTALVDALENANLSIHEEAAHALPFTEVNWCINNIQKYLHKNIFNSPNTQNQL